MAVSPLEADDPGQFLEDSADGAEISLPHKRFYTFLQVTPLRRLIGIVHGNGDVLHRARVAIAVDHATRAVIAHKLAVVKLVDRTHWRFPVMAAPQHQVPIEVEIPVAAETGKSFFRSLQMSFHVVDGGRWIYYSEFFLQRFHLVEGGKKFLLAVVHQI